MAKGKTAIIQEADAKFRNADGSQLSPRDLATKIAAAHPGVEITPQYVSTIRSKAKESAAGKSVKESVPKPKVSRKALTAGVELPLSPPEGRSLKRVSRNIDDAVSAAKTRQPRKQAVSAAAVGGMSPDAAFDVVDRVEQFITEMGGVLQAERALSRVAGLREQFQKSGSIA